MKKEKIKNKAEKTYIATECDKVGEIAIQYGFTVVKPPHVTSEDISKSKQFKDFDMSGDIDEKVALTRWYMEENLQAGSQPVMIHYKKPLPGSIKIGSLVCEPN